MFLNISYIFEYFYLFHIFSILHIFCFKVDFDMSYIFNCKIERTNFCQTVIHCVLKLARMIAIRNTLKHEKKSLELKITTIMKYVADNANTKDKVALYQELSAIDEKIATEKRH